VLEALGIVAFGVAVFAVVAGVCEAADVDVAFSAPPDDVVVASAVGGVDEEAEVADVAVSIPAPAVEEGVGVSVAAAVFVAFAAAVVASTVELGACAIEVAWLAFLGSVVGTELLPVCALGKFLKRRGPKIRSAKSTARLAPANAREGAKFRCVVIHAQRPARSGSARFVLVCVRFTGWRAAEAITMPDGSTEISASGATLSVFATSAKTCCFNRSARSFGNGRKGICSRNNAVNCWSLSCLAIRT